MAMEAISTEEAIRRIKERDHVVPPHQPMMDFTHEQATINMIQDGLMIAAFDPDTRELGFQITAKGQEALRQMREGPR
jgi:hypothetical protein